MNDTHPLVDAFLPSFLAGVGAIAASSHSFDKGVVVDFFNGRW